MATDLIARGLARKGADNVSPSGSDLLMTSGTYTEPTVVYNNDGTLTLGSGTSAHDGGGGDYTKKNLYNQQIHDALKREYAKQNNIELLEIWHCDFENIKEILYRRLNTWYKPVTLI